MIYANLQNGDQFISRNFGSILFLKPNCSLKGISLPVKAKTARYLFLVVVDPSKILLRILNLFATILKPVDISFEV